MALPVGRDDAARASRLADVATQNIALEDWQEGDAQIVVTAGALKPTSKLRKTFEAHSIGDPDDDQAARVRTNCRLSAMLFSMQSSVTLRLADCSTDFRSPTTQTGS